MDVFPVLFEIEEIISHIKTLKVKKYIIDYLINSREELILICYHFSDYQIEKYLQNRNIKLKFEKLPYHAFGDIEQTHVSRSEYIQFLRHIDKELLPFVRKELSKLYKDIKEDKSKIIKDYKIFNFQIKNILNYSNELSEDKISYLNWIKMEYIKDNNKKFNSNSLKVSSDDNLERNIRFFEILRSPFIKAVDFRINLLKRNPSLIIRNNSADFFNDLKKIKRAQLFKSEPFLFEFKFNEIKKRLESLKNFNKKLLYLVYVKKETLQNIDLLNDDKNSVPFLDKIDIEINYINEMIKHIDSNKKDKKRDDIKKVKKDKKPDDIESVSIDIKLNTDLSNKVNRIKKTDKKTNFNKTYDNKSDVIRSSHKLKWLGTEKQLKIFLYQLQDVDFIDNHLTDDKEHKQYLSLFVNKENLNYSENKTEKIRWKSETSELAYLIGEFTKSKSNPLIHGTKKWVKTGSLFFSQYGDVITPGTLRSSYNKKTIPANKEILDRIIKDVSKSL